MMDYNQSCFVIRKFYEALIAIFLLYDPCHAKEKGGIGIHLGFFSFGHEPLVDSKADKAVAK